MLILKELGIYILCITVEFDFTDTSPPVLEMVGNVTVCLENASPEVVLDRNVIINIATADGAATGSVYYLRTYSYSSHFAD